MKKIKYVFLFTLVLLSFEITKVFADGCSQGGIHAFSINTHLVNMRVNNTFKLLGSAQLELYCTVNGSSFSQYVDVPVRFSLLNPTSALTVTENGLITGKSVGTGKIRAYSATGNAYDDVTVNVHEALNSMSFGEHKKTLKVNEEESLSINTVPSGVVTSNFIWSSSDSTVVSVNNGTIKGLKEGEAVITLKDRYSDLSITTNVNVIVPITSVEVTSGEQSVGLGSSFKLELAFKPENATPRNYSWVSSNSGVATVDQEGNVTVVGPGNATISIVTEDGDEFVVKSLSLEAAQNDAVDPTDNNNNDNNNDTDATNNAVAPNNDVPDTVSNPGTGLFLTLVFGFGLCFILIGCYYLSKKYRMIRKI